MQRAPSLTTIEAFLAVAERLAPFRRRRRATAPKFGSRFAAAARGPLQHRLDVEPHFFGLVGRGVAAHDGSSRHGRSAIVRSRHDRRQECARSGRSATVRRPCQIVPEADLDSGATGTVARRVDGVFAMRCSRKIDDPTPTLWLLESPTGKAGHFGGPGNAPVISVHMYHK